LVIRIIKLLTRPSSLNHLKGSIKAYDSSFVYYLQDQISSIVRVSVIIKHIKICTYVYYLDILLMNFKTFKWFIHKNIRMNRFLLFFSIKKLTNKNTEFYITESNYCFFHCNTDVIIIKECPSCWSCVIFIQTISNRSKSLLQTKPNQPKPNTPTPNQFWFCSGFGFGFGFGFGLGFGFGFGSGFGSGSSSSFRDTLRC